MSSPSLYMAKRPSEKLRGCCWHYSNVMDKIHLARESIKNMTIKWISLQSVLWFPCMSKAETLSCHSRAQYAPSLPSHHVDSDRSDRMKFANWFISMQIFSPTLNNIRRGRCRRLQKLIDKSAIPVLKNGSDGKAINTEQGREGMRREVCHKFLLP